MKDSVLITRVVLKNYKSIAACSVRLRPLVFLVGQNGSGKSNFLDAIRFVSDALITSLDHALRERGGINEVRRRSSGHPTHFGIRIEFRLPDSTSGHYSFRVGARPKGGFEVQREECRICALPDDKFYVVSSGQVEVSNPEPLPPATEDRLFLVAASSLPEFRPLYDSLTRMGFYNLNPDELRDGLRAASRDAQVLVTSHSPDLLDDDSISDENLLAVTNRNGDTLIGPVDGAGRSAIQDRLFTAGELLRLNQLTPDPDSVERMPERQLELFGRAPG